MKSVTDEEFKKYGRIHQGYDVEEMIAVMQEMPIPKGVDYVPSVKSLEELDVFSDMTYGIFGGLPIQAGYCNGHNNKLNAFEYHRCSEINVAATDMILILGMQQDINEDFTYETQNAEIFFVPAKTVVEIYATTLHYAPCSNHGEGFRCVVVLPRDTNLELERVLGLSDEDKLMTARNKWLIAHREAGIEGAFEGLIGENLCVD